MRRSFPFTLAFCFFAAVDHAAALEPQRIPSGTLVKDLQSSSRPFGDFFDSLATSPTARKDLFEITWSIAGQRGSVDNRPYLFALALDLYNSLGPDSNGCPPDRVVDEGTSENELLCGKQYLWSEYFYHEFNPDQLERYKADEIKTGESRGYIHYYLVAVAKISGPQDSPIVDPRHLNLQTPTHYAALTRWMAETVTARAEGIPPWEAAGWNAANRHRWESASAVSDAAPLPVTAEGSTAPAVAPPVPAQELTTPTGDAATAGPAPSRGWLLAWLLGIAGIVVALLLWRRSRP